MSQSVNNYVKSVKFCFQVLACATQEDAEYMDVFMQFCHLCKSADEALEKGLVTAEKCAAIKEFFEEIDKLTYHADTFKLHTDKYYLTAPEWEPTKAAARKALTLLSEVYLVSQSVSNYVTSVKYCLQVLACSGNENAEFMEAFSDYCDLYEKRKGALRRGLVTEEKCQAIKEVFTEMAKLTDHPEVLRLHTDQSYLTAPEWEPTKAAARKALALF